MVIGWRHRLHIHGGGQRTPEFGAVSTQPPHLQLNRSAFATTRLRSSLVNSLKRLASVLTRCLKKLPLQVRPVAPRWVSDPKISQRSCCEFLRNSAVPWSTFKCFNPGQFFRHELVAQPVLAHFREDSGRLLGKCVHASAYGMMCTGRAPSICQRMNPNTKP